AVRELDQLSGLWAIDALVAVSDTALKAARHHPHPERTLRIYNGVDLKRFRPACQRTPRGPIVIGFAGRLVRGKGADVLVRSLARSSDLSITALVAGDGPDRTLLEALARRTGIASQVVFLEI